MKKLIAILFFSMFFMSQALALDNVQLLWEGDTYDHKTITIGEELRVIADITSYDPPIIAFLSLQDENGNIKHIYLDEEQYTHPQYGFSSYSGLFVISPDHYETLGEFRLVLQTIDASDDVTTRIRTFNVVPPCTDLEVEASAEPLRGEAPLDVDFGCHAQGGYPEYIYSWDFGDGNSEATQMANHVYNIPGNYSATCLVFDQYENNGSSSIIIEVLEPEEPNHAPIADFTINPNPSLIGTELTLDASNSYDPDLDSLTYSWDIGNDGDIEFTGIIAYKTFYQAKDYPIKLIVSDGEHESSVVKYAVVEEYYKDFSINMDVTPNEGFAPLTVEGTCTYETFGEGLEGTYRTVWFMGDGTTLYGESVAHTYEEVGNYSVTCKVKQIETEIIKYASEMVYVYEESYETFDVSLLLSPLEGFAPLEVSGTCDVEPHGNGAEGSYYIFWDMGDGSNYEGVQVSHVYEFVGDYEVSCEVTQLETFEKITKYAEVNVYEESYETFDVEAVLEPRSGFAPLDVEGACDIVSHNDGASASYDYFWFMGDGVTYSTKNVEHTYTEVGNYSPYCEVTQIETGVVERDWMVAEVLPAVIDYEDFNLMNVVFPLSGDAPLLVHSLCYHYAVPFSGEEASYLTEVDFGDGYISNDDAWENHLYEEVGVYDYICRVTQLETGIIKSSTKTITVTQHEEENLPPVAVIEGPNTAITFETKTFSGANSYDPENTELAYYWYVDGNLVQEGGDTFSLQFTEERDYLIELVVEDFEGLTDSANLVVSVSKKPFTVEDVEEKSDFEFVFSGISIMGHDVNTVKAGQTLYVTIGTRSDETEGRPSLIVPELGLKATGQLNEIDGRESMTAKLWIPPNTPPGYYMLRVGFKSEEVRKGEIRWFKVE